jgi:hypothetical protein
VLSRAHWGLRTNSYLESISCEGFPSSIGAMGGRLLSLLGPWAKMRTTTYGDHAPLGMGELRWAVTRSLDAELIHPVAKRVWMEVQDPRRTVWTIHHSTGMLKSGEDVVSVYLVQRQE